MRDNLTCLISHTISDFDPIAWARITPNDSPFLDYSFLQTLETSGCVGSLSGWTPVYCALFESGKLVAAAVGYLKNHSYGEYIFDWEWAHAAHSAGIAYYPKLIVAVPFTPATTSKFLIREDHQHSAEELKTELIRVVEATATDLGARSVHWLFTTQAELESLQKAGYIGRWTHQFHWQNRQYPSFDAFLSGLKSRKRKHILKERSSVNEDLGARGMQIEEVRSGDLQHADAVRLYALYWNTTTQYGSHPYLNEKFFTETVRSSSALVAFVVRDKGEIAAMSLCFEKGSSLYGRYWGTSLDLQYLHFELCYYRPIEYAIARGLTRFEAGAQGGHKIARGLDIAPIFSAHRFTSQPLHDAVERAVREEVAAVRALLADPGDFTAYRNDKSAQ